jgi:hypothetical protein
MLFGPIGGLWLMIAKQLDFLRLQVPLAILFGIAALAFLCVGFKWKFQRIARGYLLAVCAFGFLLLFHPSYLAMPLSSTLIVLCAFALCLPIASVRLRAAGGALFALSLTVLFLFDFSILGSFVGFSYALLFALAALNKRSWIKQKAVVFLCLATIGLSFQMYSFFLGPVSKATIDKVQAKPNIETIFRADTPDRKISNVVGGRGRFVMDNCDDSLIIGSRRSTRAFGLHILRYTSKANYLPIDAVSDFILVDCPRNAIWAAEFHRNILIRANTETDKVVEKIEGFDLPGIARMRMGKSGKIYASSDTANGLLIYDPESGAQKTLQFDHLMTDFLIDEDRNLLIAARPGGEIFQYQFSPLKHQKTILIPDLIVQLEADLDLGIGYFTRFYNGDLIRVNLATMEIIDKKKLTPGVRFVTFDKVNERLFISNFLTGDVVMLRQNDLEIMDRANFGPRIRNINLSRDGKRLYGASAAGGFAWKLGVN